MKKISVRKWYEQYEPKTVKVYFVLRFLVILTLIRSVFLGNLDNVFMCLLTLLLFTLPSIIQRTIKIDLPSAFEIIILIFIFSAEILGEINNFYGRFPYWDTILHTISGFLFAAVGVALIDVLNENDTFRFKVSPLFAAMVAFCFSMTIGIAWEFLEYSLDQFLSQDTQKDTLVQHINSVYIDPAQSNTSVIIQGIYQTDIHYTGLNGESAVFTIENGYLDIGLHDTMKDLFVNFIGALLFSIIGYYYIGNREKYKNAERFIPKRMSESKRL